MSDVIFSLWFFVCLFFSFNNFIYGFQSLVPRDSEPVTPVGPGISNIYQVPQVPLMHSQAWEPVARCVECFLSWECPRGFLASPFCESFPKSPC